MNMKYVKLFLIVFVIFTCAIGTISIFNGCKTMQSNQNLKEIQDTGIRGLLAAKNEIAALANQYDAIYQRSSDKAKEKWKKEIDPYFLEADEIFNEWLILINTGQDTSDVYSKYIMIRKILLTAIIEIEEG